MMMFFIGLLVGGSFGAIMMAVFSAIKDDNPEGYEEELMASSYVKGLKDGRSVTVDKCLTALCEHCCVYGQSICSKNYCGQYEAMKAIKGKASDKGQKND